MAKSAKSGILNEKYFAVVTKTENNFHIDLNKHNTFSVLRYKYVTVNKAREVKSFTSHWDRDFPLFILKY